MKSFKDQTFVIIDVETTGLSPRNGDRVIEVAALKVKNYQSFDRYTTLINPNREISFGAYLVNHISDDMVAQEPYFHEIVDNLSRFMEGACLVGHNIKFDIGFLSHEFDVAGKEWPESLPWLDTIKMARGFVPYLSSYSLASVSYELGVTQGQVHRAMADVEMTAEVFCHLLRMAEKNHISDPDLLVKLFGSRKTEERRLFKHKKTTLLQAIEKGTPVTFLYSSQQSGTIHRKVTPSELVGTGARSRLVGYCHLRQEERSFSLNKMVRVETVS